MARSRGPTDEEGAENANESSEPSEREAGPAYEVGYGKPPREHQFGYGNKMAKGRRRGSRNIGTIYNELAKVKVATKVGDRIKKVPKREIVLTQLINNAVKGDFKAITKIIDLEERYGPREDAAGSSAEQMQRDRAALQTFLDLRKGAVSKNEG
jgi:Family of unknown function (DUF5681)